ncbi:disease resistance protein RPV1-like [Gossypium arboreum]|uniref:disease resistance protein RPV1-like n=1 Tax=Gossypium arboreum TaxID=29729 RepID=UPI0022F1B6E9|nr:disease resistance protein RPV1-like [Gossypium arboreum]
MLASRSSFSSSSAAAADMIKARTYDVFISFRGEDTRDGFLSHLYKDLCRKNIDTFVDSEKLRRGDEISEALLTAIQGSRVSVIVFSKDYASSKWCLAELVKIMDCNKWIVPVFYGVDPRDVRNQRGSFAEAFAKHEENFKHELEKVKTWRSALTAAGKLSGWDSQVTRPDSTLVDKIVEDIVKKLNCGTSSPNLKGLVGIERRMQEVLSLFQDGFPDFRMLGIWGMGGIGKTTLADAIYHHVSNGFQSCCFLANVREHDEQRKLLKLRQKLLSNILGDEKLDISTLTIGSGFLKDRLSKKKVLIVCDDVSTLSQLEFLIGGVDWFGPGSRVIVTTRDKQVLIQFDIYPDCIYEVEELDGDESVELFCQRAFKSSHPIEYQLELSKMILSVANGNPLAIRLIGSSLRGKSQSYQESEVKKLKQVPKQDIQNVLKWSFDALDCEEKEMFLDIACFFKGKDRDHVTRFMDACYVSAHSGIENLIDKSLIFVSKNHIAMHDLLQQMGWNTVRNESPFKPKKRSRLWIPEDSYNVLSENNGTETLTGIVLDMSTLPKLELDPAALMKMRKLRFLNFYNSCGRILLFKGLLSFPEELRYLYWEGYPLRSLPTKFDLRYLVELDMSRSHLEQLWEGKQDIDAAEAPSLMLMFTNCFKLGEKSMGKDIDVGDSTSVEEVSSIEKVLKQAAFCKSLGWLFTNCFLLDQKAASGPETPKLEMPFEHMVTVLKDYHQGPPESKRRIKILTCVPGSEIPEWFDFKSLGSSINIQLPSEWWSNNFVASVVVSFPDSSFIDIGCECHLKSCNGDNHVLSCSFSSFSLNFENQLSDHLFLLYGGEVWEFAKSKASNKRFYNQASFNFYLRWIGSSEYEASNKRMYNGAWFKFYPLVFNGDWSQSVCCEVKHYGVHISFAEEEAEVQPYKRFKYQS